MEDGEDPYEILGVPKTATKAEIKRAYFRLARLYHPDKATNEEEVKWFTLLMFKINDAKEILLDDDSRRKHDAERDQPRPEPPPPGQEYADDHPRQRARPRPTFRPRPRPEDLGNPYQGPTEPRDFAYFGDGEAGTDADDGEPGQSGYNYGMDGQDGSDATPAGNGSPGVDWKIFIRTVVSDDGYFEVYVDGTTGTEVLDPRREYDRSIPLKSFQKVDWSARGGCGGRGGRGGDGGDGYRGYPGQDATRRRCGTNGGPGGDGGRGGYGTSGGHGARGGHVEILLDLFDTYVLMLVEGCDPANDTDRMERVRGGRGGLSGRHGIGGFGGSGGRGGSAYHWAETVTEFRDGATHFRTITHSNPGGSSGRSGRRGATPRIPLHNGTNGQDGTFQIKVKLPNGSTRLYPSRYDLRYVSMKTKELSDMLEDKTYEFGETVIVTGQQVKNTGQMETPIQRVMIVVEETHCLDFNRRDLLFLSRGTHVAAGRTAMAQEAFLRFTCHYPSTLTRGTDFEPIRQEAWIRYAAYQLGPENRVETVSRFNISDFSVKYQRFHAVTTGDEVQLAYPVENQDGVRGVRTLGPNETTFLEMTLVNTSRQSFGDHSGTARALFVQIYYADDQHYEIPLEHVRVRGDGGRIINIDPTRSPKGHRKTISFLAGQGSTLVQVSLKLAASRIRTAARAALQADIYLQKIPTLFPDGSKEETTRKRLIQRRIFVVSCQPKFDVHAVERTDVLLVTTTASTADQVSAWSSLFRVRLGLEPQIYSLSRYGHLDAARRVEGAGLQQCAEGKLVVVLNDKFVAQPNHKLKRKTESWPSQLVNSVFDFRTSTRFLVVGGGPDAVDHLSPKSTGINTVLSRGASAKAGSSALAPSSPNRKTYTTSFTGALESERADGFSLKIVEPSCHPVTVKTKAVFRPKQPKMERILDARAKKLSKWLAKRDRLRPHIVEWKLAEQPNRVSRRLVTRCWEIGQLRVYTGPPRFQSSLVVVTDDRENLQMFSSTNSIQSLSMLFAAVQALPFDVQLKCYVRSIRALAQKESQADVEVCQAVNDCLINDFLWDVSNYSKGRMKVERSIDRSPTSRNLLVDETLCRLVDESIANDALRKALTPQLTSLLAGLRCVADSKDFMPWWNPFSRKHGVRKSMRETLAPLEVQWRHVLDDKELKEQQQTIERDARLYIRKERKKFWLRRRGRWRAALKYLFSPKNENRYPRAQGFASPTARIRKQAELGSGETMKIKAFSSESLGPSEATEIWQRQSSRTLVRTETYRDVVSDDIRYRLFDGDADD